MSLTLHSLGPDLPAPDPEVPCCETAAYSNGKACSCWEPIFSAPTPPVLLEGPQAPRPKMCHDCAYRPGSPERTEVDGEQLEAPLSQPFQCHDGMPKLLGWTHPELPGACLVAAAIGDRDSFGPVIRGAQSWRADGTPALMCAGWVAVSGARGHRR